MAFRLARLEVHQAECKETVDSVQELRALVKAQEQVTARENRQLLALRQYVGQIEGERSDQSKTTFALSEEVEKWTRELRGAAQTTPGRSTFAFRGIVDGGRTAKEREAGDRNRLYNPAVRNPYHVLTTVAPMDLRGSPGQRG